MKDVQSQILKLRKLSKRKKIGYGIFGVLSSVVAFFTVYFLMLPASALDPSIKYKFTLIDTYNDATYAWKDGMGNREFELDLYFVDMSDNNITSIGRDVRLEIGSGQNQYNDDPYSFGYVPINNKEAGTTRGLNFIENDNLLYFETSTGEKYEFDHAEVYANGAWRSYKTDQGRHWDIWCQNASQTDTKTDYGWRGEYVDGNTVVKFDVDATTKFKFVYKLVRYGEDSEYTVPTLDSSLGISFGLYDYSGTNNATGVNANGLYNYFSFRSSQLDSEKYGAVHINPDTDADGYTENHASVLPNLSNGYPVFDCKGVSGCTNTSLGYLYGENVNASGVTVYNPTNTLLQIDPNDGYYYYDSDLNAVDYDTYNERFMVRSYREKGYTLAKEPLEHTHSEFYPFTYWIHSDGTKTNSTTGATYNYEVDELNNWFGMTMQFSFNMPKNGLVNDEDMIFSFSGDDDVWVFIDNVLVLDLGGTHGRVTGTINFKTGVVSSQLEWNGKTGTVEAGTAKVTNIYEAFVEAGEVENVDWNEDKTTFANYSGHTVKFFYLERGAAVSNCKIRFNIPVIPSGSISVQKELEGTNDYDESYKFLIYDKTNEQALANQSYKIGDNTYNTDENGYFTLKKQQKATFILTNDNEYYIEEIDSGSFAESYKCSVNGKETGCENTSKTNLITIDPESSYLVLFTNKVTASNLTINKVVSGTDEDETFNFKLTLKDSEGNIINKIKENPEEYLFDSDNGIVTFSLKNGENVVIEGIPTGAKINIEEINSEGFTTYMKENDIYVSNKAKGEITLNANRNITVYNVVSVLLPETGGIGTIIVMLTGLILMLIPFVYKFITYLRIKSREIK